MPAYHYQCANCYCTLNIEEEPADGIYYSVVNGEICWSCEQQQQQQQYEDDD
jgi:Zn-finger protein